MVLSILLKTGNNVTHLGSGFVANKTGLFITAAHFLKEHFNEIERILIAFPDKGNPCTLYKIRVLYQEYFDPCNATAEEEKKKKLPYHQDLAICRILSFKTKEHFKIQRKRPKQNEILTVKGFYNPKKVSVPINDNIVDLSFLANEDTSFQIKHRLFSIISKDNITLKVKVL